MGPTLTPLSRLVTPTQKLNYANISMGENFKEIPRVLPYRHISGRDKVIFDEFRNYANNGHDL